MRLQLTGVAVGVGLLLAAGIGYSVPGLAGGASSSVAKEVPFVLTLVVIGATLTIEHLIRRIGPFSILFLASMAYAVIFAIVPIADVAFHNPAVNTPSWALASWLALGGYVGLACGYFAAMALVDPHLGSPVVHWRTEPWRARRAFLFAVAGLAIGFVAVLASIGGPSGISHFITSFQDRRQFLQLKTPGRIAISFAIPSIALAGITWARRPSLRLGLVYVVILVPLALLITGYRGERADAFGILLTVVATVHILVRRIPTRVLLPLFIVGFALFIYVGEHRNVVGTTRTAPPLSGQNFYYNYVASHELGQFRDFATMLDAVPSQIPYQWGATFLSVIPQAPFPTGGQILTDTFYPQLVASGTSFPPSLLGELAMNFGAPLVPVGMLLYGGLLGTLTAGLRSRKPALLVVYMCSLEPVTLILRGDFTTFGGFWLSGLLGLAIALWFIRVRTPGRQRSALRWPEMPYYARHVAPRAGLRTTSSDTS